MNRAPHLPRVSRARKVGATGARLETGGGCWAAPMISQLNRNGNRAPSTPRVFLTVAPPRTTDPEEARAVPTIDHVVTAPDPSTRPDYSTGSRGLADAVPAVLLDRRERYRRMLRDPQPHDPPPRYVVAILAEISAALDGCRVAL